MDFVILHNEDPIKVTFDLPGFTLTYMDGTKCKISFYETERGRVAWRWTDDNCCTSTDADAIGRQIALYLQE